MSRSLFPTRIETEHLRFEPISHETTDPFELYEFVRQEDWQGAATEHMPWFRFEHLGHVTDFIDKAEQQWRDHETARYILRATDEAETLVGLTAYGPEWKHDERDQGSSSQRSTGVVSTASNECQRSSHVRPVRLRRVLHDVCRHQRVFTANDRKVRR